MTNWFANLMMSVSTAAFFCGGCGGVAGGGGVCTQSCDAISAALSAEADEFNSMSFDDDAAFDADYAVYQCRIGPFALEAWDCDCGPSRDLMTREGITAHMQAFCDAAADSGVIDGVQPESADPARAR